MTDLRNNFENQEPGTLRYNVYKEVIRQGEKLKTFADYLDNLCSETTTEEELLQAYDHPIQIIHNDHRVSIPFSAETYNILVKLLEEAMEEF
jgi:hypothetical protein